MRAAVTVNNFIHDNTVISTNAASAVGAVADYNPAGMKAGGNHMDANHYFYPQLDEDRFFPGRSGLYFHVPLNKPPARNLRER